MTAPCDAQAFAVAIDKLFKFGRTFGLKNQATEDATKFYREALKDLPADLVVKAVDGAIKSWKWGNRLPLPADLMDEVKDEWARRRLAKTRLKVAMGRVV
ncbi:MAG: hypothetical protein H8E94_02455 [Alphaproteobacteria bacterium]|nr:hypothetical protein [Alphaproteobacteria bacterium]